MTRPKKLDSDAVDGWLARHPGWARDDDALVRSIEFPDFAAGMAFAVRLGMLAEKRDHHPELRIGWGKVRVLWTTHDAGGVTELDLSLAEASDRYAGG